MIIFIIYIKGITTFNLECNSPVSTDIDRPSSFTISLELVEAQAWQIHIIKSFSRFEEREDPRDPGYMLGIHTARNPGFK